MSTIALRRIDSGSRRTYSSDARRKPPRSSDSIACPAAGTSANAEHGRGGERARQQLERQLGDHAERALGADEARDEIVPGDALRGAPPAAQHLAAHLETEHVLARDAVLERTRTAGVRRGADRAELERRRIRRIEQPLLLDGFLQPPGHDARLDDRDQIAGVDLFDRCMRSVDNTMPPWIGSAPPTMPLPARAA